MVAEIADMSCPAPSSALNPLFMVPFDRDDSFIDRNEIFTDVNKYIRRHGRAALLGIGGIGSVTLTGYHEKLYLSAKMLLESHKLRSNTATDIGMTILIYTSSGFMPVQSNDLIKHTGR